MNKMSAKQRLNLFTYLILADTIIVFFMSFYLFFKDKVVTALIIQIVGIIPALICLKLAKKAHKRIPIEEEVESLISSLSRGD